MKKIITIVSDVDEPVLHLLNREDYDVSEVREDYFAIIKKENEKYVRGEKDITKII